MDQIIETIFNAVLDGDSSCVQQNIQAGLDAGLPPEQLLSEGMIAAMKDVGERFENGEYYVPEMLVSARAMQMGLAFLKPHLVLNGVQMSGKVVIGTVKGDLHDIGKNLVAMMLEGAGFDVKDLGVDVPPDRFVQAIQAGQAEIIALSALLTTTMPVMQIIIDEITHAGLRDCVKIMVGGAPLTEEYAIRIGADGYSPDASRAVGLAQSLLTKE